MRTVLTIALLEVYAGVLAWMQLLGGVRTDEAKYLLNIPYPHPPVARWIFSLLEQVPHAELLWRVVLASLVVQAVWLAASFFPLSKGARVALGACWLCGAAVVTQAGSIMLAPVTAVQYMLCLWLLTRSPETLRRNEGWIVLGWLLSLFTAFHAALAFPILLSLFRRSGRSRLHSVLLTFAPLGLLALYMLSNPLSIAALLLTPGVGGELSTAEKLWESAWLAVVAGSGIVSLVGGLGLLQRRTVPVLMSALLVFAYITISPQPYYAMLLAPFLVFGVGMFSLRISPVLPASCAVLAVIVTLLLFPSSRPSFEPTSARAVVASIPSGAGEYLLINGSFGHEWQWESALPVRRLTPSLLDDAAAIVCVEPCMDFGSTYRILGGEHLFDVWISAGN